MNRIFTLLIIVLFLASCKAGKVSDKSIAYLPARTIIKNNKTAAFDKESVKASMTIKYKGKEEYSLNKDYSTLKLLLERQLKTRQYLDLLKDSEEGLSLFPAQPFLYLMNGKALNSLRKYNEAKLTLEEGLDYIIDDDSLKADIFEEMSLSHKALGDNKSASEYYQRAVELRGK